MQSALFWATYASGAIADHLIALGTVLTSIVPRVQLDGVDPQVVRGHYRAIDILITTKL